MINLKKNSYFTFNMFLRKFKENLVRLLGFEPRTSWSVAKRSIQLSYRRNINLTKFKDSLLLKKNKYQIL